MNFEIIKILSHKKLTDGKFEYYVRINDNGDIVKKWLNGHIVKKHREVFDSYWKSIRDNKNNTKDNTKNNTKDNTNLKINTNVNASNKITNVTNNTNFKINTNVSASNKITNVTNNKQKYRENYNDDSDDEYITKRKKTSDTDTKNDKKRKIVNDSDNDSDDDMNRLTKQVEVADMFYENKKQIQRQTSNTINEQKPMINEEEEEQEYDENTFEIENILEMRNDNNNKRQYLIKWVGHIVPTWINETDFNQTELLNEFKAYQMTNEQTTTNRAYIYTRTSKRNDVNEISLYEQEKECLKFAKTNKINIIGAFRDNGVSGKHISGEKRMHRQFALQHIINNIKEGECILIYDITRFSRSVEDAIPILELLRNEKKVFVHSIRDKLTWNNIPTNRHLFRQVLSSSQLYSDVISDKIKSAIEFKRERGDHVGYVPYGYKTELINDVRKLVLNKDERVIIKYVIDLARNAILDKMSELNINKVTKKKIFTNKDTQKLTNLDYKNITNEVNKKYKNRGNKYFKWTFIKLLISRWIDKKIITK